MKPLACFVVLALLTVWLSGCDSIIGEDTEESYTVGVINPSPVLNSFFDDYFVAMQELGYVDGQNLEVISAGPAETTLEALALPGAFVDVELDILVVFSIELALISSNTLPDVDIVFIGAGDPLASGLLEDLTQPGSNVTGVLAQDVSERRLQLLLEIAPHLSRIAVPYDSADTRVLGSLEGLREAAEQAKVTLTEIPMESSDDFPDMIEEFPEDVEAIFLLQDEQQVLLLRSWEAFAREQEIMLVIPGTASPEAFNNNGYLMGYGVSLSDTAKQAALLSSQILRGTSPGDLPIENGEVRLFIDLSVAEKLGIEVPDYILTQADYVIRSAENDGENEE